MPQLFYYLSNSNKLLRNFTPNPLKGAHTSNIANLCK